MSEIIELVYASRASFTPVGGGGIEPEVARILAQSRRNNPRHNVGGVLCYRDNNFLQCLEGETRDVEAVYQKIATDPRHRDVKILSRRPVARRRFKSWSMKYAAVDSAISNLLQKNGQQRFNPHVFGNDLLVALVALLHQATDPGATPQPQPERMRVRHVASPLLAGGALAMAMAALAVALVALHRTIA